MTGMAPTAPTATRKLTLTFNPRMLGVGGLVVATGLVLAGLYMWMVQPAAAREAKSACAGMRPTAAQPALCPKDQPNCVLPQPAPDFTVNTYDGKQVHLSQFRGKVVLLNFWASWCGVCKSEKPALIEMAKELASKDYVVVTLASDADWAKVLVAIAIAHNPAKVPERFRRVEPAPDAPTMAEALAAYQAATPDGLPYQVFLDPPNGDSNIGSVAASWGIKAVPESFLIDRNGMVRYYFVNKREWNSSVAGTCLQSVIDEGADGGGA